ncbi:hypothetical protein GH714_035287 [Hevea brasiliensis]|uniref:Serine-threonine/tyrosine-protein kinase catalytic domain-containing protein n=1 Tax=Hevea brasiliensis TaxID=3981 RepID=A0A6A6NEE3_HEVBR|nr:hypothetical protein GH714_035287 [Hevea brasiliensis]
MKEIVLALKGYIPPNSIDNLLQPMVQKLPIISEIDDDDTVGFQVCKPRIFTYQQLERATQDSEEYRQISKKSDIYAFGIVLLELITGRKAKDKGVNIVDWV